MQQSIVEAAGNLEHVSRGFEALMFAIYAFAVTSLNPQECESKFGEPKPILLDKYRLGTQKALVRAGFLRSSDLVILQAFVLYLVSLPHLFHLGYLPPAYKCSSLFARSTIIVRFGHLVALPFALAKGSAFIATAPLWVYQFSTLNCGGVSGGKL